MYVKFQVHTRAEKHVQKCCLTRPNYEIHCVIFFEKLRNIFRNFVLKTLFPVKYHPQQATLCSSVWPCKTVTPPAWQKKTISCTHLGREIHRNLVTVAKLPNIFCNFCQKLRNIFRNFVLYSLFSEKYSHHKEVLCFCPLPCSNPPKYHARQKHCLASSTA